MATAATEKRMYCYSASIYGCHSCRSNDYQSLAAFCYNLSKECCFSCSCLACKKDAFTRVFDKVPCCLQLLVVFHFSLNNFVNLHVMSVGRNSVHLLEIKTYTYLICIRALLPKICRNSPFRVPNDYSANRNSFRELRTALSCHNLQTPFLSAP